MRPMNPAEESAVATRRAQFDAFYSELIPVLVSFVDRLGITPAHAVLTDAVAFAPLVGTALRDMQVESSEDRVWLLTRVGYFVGEYLVQHHGGCWFVNDDPDSASFARFVVGRFAALGGSQARVDPFAVAAEYVDSLPGVDLPALLADVDVALVNLAVRAG